MTRVFLVHSRPGVIAAIAILVLAIAATATIATTVTIPKQVESSFDAVWHGQSRFAASSVNKIHAGPNSNVVNSTHGPIMGVVTATHRYFLGIPFSQPPVGSLRWSAPLTPPKWAPRVLNATVKGPACPQHCVLPPHMCPTVQSEDCLFLNIYTPLPSAVRNGSLLPVMFFMPGGRFEQGEAASPLYRGDYMANMTQTILVDTNYRFGSFGFLRTDTFNGNYAVQDQRLALRWVIDNIANFGGNPNLITMFGQSAGASSTAVHLASPLSQGLFQRAIIESNPFTLPMKSVAEAKEISRWFVEEIGCVWNREDTDNCLRSKNATAVLNAEMSSQKNIPWWRPLTLFLPWTPVSGTEELPLNPIDAIQQGKFQNMPIMLGTVSEEALFFIYEASKGNTVSEAEYLSIIVYVFGDAAVSVLEQYPPGDPFAGTDYRPLLSKLGTEYIFRCTNRVAANGFAKFNPLKRGDNVYYYEFDHIMSFNEWGNYTFCREHTCHGAELPFVFHSVAPYDEFSPEEAKLSASMTTYWTNFARYGNPNGLGKSADPYLPKWQPYTGSSPSQQNYMKLATPPVAGTGLDLDICNFWDTVGYRHGV